MLLQLLVLVLCGLFTHTRCFQQQHAVFQRRHRHQASGLFSSDLLYQEQEQLLVRRGELEEQLMTNTSPLPANTPKVRGAGGGGGFGGASKSKRSVSALKSEGKAHAKILKKDGVVRIDHVLSPATADALREYVYNLRAQATEQVNSGSVPPLERFADVLLRTNRCDLTLPLGQSPILSRALHEVLRGSAAGYTMSHLLSQDAILYELSTLISDPGSQRQVVHPDTPVLPDQEAVLYTCFVALQDVKLDMGPTLWLPKTHHEQAHQQFKLDTVQTPDQEESPKDALLRNTPAVLGLLPQGACAIFDSRTLHCGTANASSDQLSRALFYFSFKTPKVGYPGNPASIRPALGRREVTLKELGKELDLFHKGKETKLLQEWGDMLR